MTKRILIVDDSKFMRMTLGEILKKGNYEIAGEAEDSKSAIEKFNELKPDLVTMDIIMPGEDGIKTVEEIIKIDDNAKIIMVTAVGQEALIVKSMLSGAKGFIIKPFKAEDVIKEIDKVLK